jgi:hypothetical protein
MVKLTKLTMVKLTKLTMVKLVVTKLTMRLKTN